MIDSHAHLVAADNVRYPPTPLKGELDRVLEPFTAEDLLRQMDENQVERAVVVQRAHVYGFNNAYVADCAERFSDRLVAVGMIDTLDPKAPDLVRYWVKERGMAGIRMTEAVKGQGAAWVSGPIAIDVWRTAVEVGASLCFHFLRGNRGLCLPALAQMCARFPDASVVVDHFGNLIGEQGPPDYGVDAATEDLVAFPKVIQKFSMINIAKLVDLGLPVAPVVQRVVRSFGADRVMWGSDVAQSRGVYADMVARGREAVATLGEDDERKVLHDTARSLYWR